MKPKDGLGNMKGITLKVIASIILCSMAVVLVLGGLGVSQNKSVLSAEAKETLLYAGEKYANEFSVLLRTTETMVNTVSAAASTLFTVADYRGNRAAFEVDMEAMEGMIKDTLTDATAPLGLYLTFSPGATGGKDELWYSTAGTGQIIDMPSSSTSANGWLVEGNATVDYYYHAIEKGKTWETPGFDPGVNAESVAYCRAVYDRNGEFIGVAGADIVLHDILATVENINQSIKGYSVLLDEKYNCMAGSGNESLFDNPVLRQELGSALTAGRSSGIAEFLFEEESYIASYAFLPNGWILALAQPAYIALEPVNQLRDIIILLSVLLFLFIICYAFFFSNKTVRPFVREAEQKDILLVNQSRQAQMGEMLGNIAHQWKQPLNSMNLALSNMKDDSRSGELAEEDFDRYIERMRDIIKNLSDTVDDFKDFLNPNRGKERFSANKEIRKALGFMKESIEMASIHVEILEEGELFLYGYRNEFCQGIFNLLDNARDAIIEAAPARRLLRVKLSQGNASDQTATAIIEIFNNGSPIDRKLAPFLFDAYFTTKTDRGGSGIGLYLTKKIVEEHFGGQISCENTEGGVVFRILAPLAEETGESQWKL